MDLVERINDAIPKWVRRHELERDWATSMFVSLADAALAYNSKTLDISQDGHTILVSVKNQSRFSMKLCDRCLSFRVNPSAIVDETNAIFTMAESDEALRLYFINLMAKVIIESKD